MTAQESIEQLKIKYELMPNRGAALNVKKNGEVDNGMCILAKFANAVEAKRALTSVGFIRGSYGWKLTY